MNDLEKMAVAAGVALVAREIVPLLLSFGPHAVDAVFNFLMAQPRAKAWIAAHPDQIKAIADSVDAEIDKDVSAPAQIAKP